jgi:hydrogenase-4 component F
MMEFFGMIGAELLWGYLAIPVLAIAFILLVRRPRLVPIIASIASFLEAVLSIIIASEILTVKKLTTFGELFTVDAFSVWHLVVLTLIVFLSASLFSLSYFNKEHILELKKMKRFGILWMGALGTMSLVLISGNIGIMWVSIEATTLFTAFLIIRDDSAASLEAMWKYIIMCSVGVAFAFIGTLLIAAAAQQAGLVGNDTLLFSKIYSVKEQLNPVLVMAGFIFLLIGYGTKAGLAPLHNWLPDAHSQAPAPVSAMFSGFLLNTALYSILRFLPLADAAGAPPGRALDIMMILGVLSVLMAAAFIVFQKDAKRMLAYCSVENMGIIVLGYSLGPIGTLGALFHTLNHSIAKTGGFFAAGKLGQMIGSNNLSEFDGAAKTYPVWGIGLAVSLLALTGAAPFALFISEFQIIKAAVDSGRYAALVLFLIGTVIVFIVMLRHAIRIAWNPVPVGHAGKMRISVLEALLVFIPLGLLLVLGLWLPDFIHAFMEQASGALWGMK